MKPTKSHLTEVSNEELELLKTMRENSNITPQIMNMVKQFGEEIDSGMDAYTAELQVVEYTRKIGGLMVEQWAIKTEDSLVQHSGEDQNLTKHGKKNSTGTAPLGE